jgi:hypothetical protein
LGIINPALTVMADIQGIFISAIDTSVRGHNLIVGDHLNLVCINLHRDRFSRITFRE